MNILKKLSEWGRSFRVSEQPYMSQPTYAYERCTAMTFPIIVGLGEGSVVGVLAQKAFHVSPFTFAVIMASGTFANITSMGWTRVSLAKSKIPFVTMLMVLSILLTAAIGLLPLNPTGGLLLAVLIITIRCLLAGFVTLRSILWRQNYPRSLRAKITGKFSILAGTIIGVIPLMAYALLDKNIESFRIIYPFGALVSGIGVYSFSKIIIRGEKELLAFERSHHSPPAPEQNEIIRKTGFWKILRDDHFYRRYMSAQFVLGFANIMNMAMIVYAVSEMTTDYKNEYFLAILLTTFIPFVVSAITLPAWSKVLDRMHIVHFRLRQINFFFLEQIFSFFAIALGNLPLLICSRISQGIGRGGAALAWTLGHNDFADKKLVSIYMGIHVTLTGVRGAIAPFVGILLYAGWEANILFPAFNGFGHYMFLVSAMINVLSIYLFHRLKKEIPQNNV